MSTRRKRLRCAWLGDLVVGAALFGYKHLIAADLNNGACSDRRGDRGADLDNMVDFY
jgi:hypothetical protein